MSLARPFGHVQGCYGGRCKRLNKGSLGLFFRHMASSYKRSIQNHQKEKENLSSTEKGWMWSQSQNEVRNSKYIILHALHPKRKADGEVIVE